MNPSIPYPWLKKAHLHLTSIFFRCKLALRLSYGGNSRVQLTEKKKAKTQTTASHSWKKWKLQSIVLAKWNNISPTYIDFPEISGFPLPNHHLGAQVVWGRYNLTRLLLDFKQKSQKSPSCESCCTGVIIWHQQKNFMHYCKGNPWKLPYMCSFFDPPKWVPFNDPCWCSSPCDADFFSFGSPTCRCSVASKNCALAKGSYVCVHVPSTPFKFDLFWKKKQRPKANQ